MDAWMELREWLPSSASVSWWHHQQRCLHLTGVLLVQETLSGIANASLFNITGMESDVTFLLNALQATVPHSLVTTAVEAPPSFRWPRSCLAADNTHCYVAI